MSQHDTPQQTFTTPGPVELDVRNMCGSVEVVATDTTTSTVEVRPLSDSREARELAEHTRVELSRDGRRLTVAVPDRRPLLFSRGQPIAVTVGLPAGSRARLRTASAESTCRGRLDRLEVETASGTMSAEEVTDAVEVHAASAAVRLGAVGHAVVKTASGAIRIGSATGHVRVHVASGRVEIGAAAESVVVRSASGDITVDEVSNGRIELATASGDARVGVRAGVVTRLDLVTVSGRVRSELPVEDAPPLDGSPLDIRVKTVSGNILVTRSANTAAA